ncbi:MAG TPA: DUF2793 domain-containing protein [Rhodobacteraceae bacterium]|nr:DUF2793 domain-containing protein [Paracoccaceae bacterium]
MSDNSANLSLPYILPSQAQKHVTHNEGMRRLDALVQLSVISASETSPPASPSEGDRYILPNSSTGAWAGQDGKIAVYEQNNWAYYTPRSGWTAWIADIGEQRVYDGTSWALTTAPANFQNLEYVGISTTADTINRLAVSSEATLLSHASAGHQLKINKAADTDTASLLFQTNWAGRAEMGTVADDNFTIKVSNDGNNFREAISIDNSSGAVRFPNGIDPDRTLPAGLTMGGGTDWWGPADPFTAVYSSGSSLSLSQNRVYFAAFYVDRPLQLLGGFVSLNVASSTAGAVLRCGVYNLGTPNGDNWDVGGLVADFGTLPATSAENKIFDLSTPVIVQKGWYLTAVGVNGAAAKARYARWLEPGTSRFYPRGSGSSCYPASIAPQPYLYENSSSSEIANGFPGSWSNNPVTTTSTTNNWIFQMVTPKWRFV